MFWLCGIACLTTLPLFTIAENLKLKKYSQDSYYDLMDMLNQ